jgi:hypothetical protein
MPTNQFLKKANFKKIRKLEMPPMVEQSIPVNGKIKTIGTNAVEVQKKPKLQWKSNT